MLWRVLDVSVDDAQHTSAMEAPTDSGVGSTWVLLNAGHLSLRPIHNSFIVSIAISLAQPRCRKSSTIVLAHPDHVRFKKQNVVSWKHQTLHFVLIQNS